MNAPPGCHAISVTPVRFDTCRGVPPSAGITMQGAAREEGDRGAVGRPSRARRCPRLVREPAQAGAVRVDPPEMRDPPVDLPVRRRQHEGDGAAIGRELRVADARDIEQVDQRHRTLRLALDGARDERHAGRDQRENHEQAARHRNQASITCENRARCLIVSIGRGAIRMHLASAGRDRERPAAPQAPKPPADRIETRADKAERKALEGRAPSVPGFHEVMRCSRCAQRVHRRDCRRLAVQALRRRPPFLRPVRVVRRRPAVRMHADDSRADLPEGCAKHVRAVLAARHRRARNALEGAAAGARAARAKRSMTSSSRP